MGKIEQPLVLGHDIADRHIWLVIWIFVIEERDSFIKHCLILLFVESQLTTTCKHISTVNSSSSETLAEKKASNRLSNFWICNICPRTQVHRHPVRTLTFHIRRAKRPSAQTATTCCKTCVGEEPEIYFVKMFARCGPTSVCTVRLSKSDSFVPLMKPAAWSHARTRTSFLLVCAPRDEAAVVNEPPSAAATGPQYVGPYEASTMRSRFLKAVTLE